MSIPLVSIIIPFYNAERYLAETIQCAINQTWANKEIILVNDGSTDGSLTIASKYDYKELKVFSQENKGSGAARNKGLTEAQGEYVQFLDSDDLLSRDKIQKQISLLLPGPDKVAVCSTVHFFDGDDPAKGILSDYEDSFLFDTNDPAAFLCNLYGGNDNRASMIQTNAWLTPASIIKKAGAWSEFYSPDDDGEFFCRVVLASAGVVFAKDCLNYYRKFRSNNNLAAIKTKQAVHGKFQSFLLKKNHLLKVANNATAKKALVFNAMNLALEAYAVDEDLTREILKIVEELGGTNYVPVMGGKQIEYIKKLFGWKAARKLQLLKQKLL